MCARGFAIHSEHRLPIPIAQIREASNADTDALVALINRAFGAEAFCIIGDRTNVTDIQSRHSTGKFLVIDSDDRSSLIGSVYCSIVGQRGYLGLLAVHPDAQGRGLSSRLIGALEDRCRQAGCNFVDLTVVNVRHNLFPFYARFGYAAYDVLPFPVPEAARMPMHLVKLTKALHAPGALAAPLAH